MARIAASLHAITGRIERESRSLGIETHASDARGPHMLGLRLPPDVLAGASSVFEAAGVHVGMRSSAVRVAPHLYTDENDLDRLFTVLKRLMAPR